MDTRYADAPEDAARSSHGAVTVIEPDGALVWETRFERAADGSFVAPKSIAVDPRSGEVWVNTDTFAADGSLARHETLRLSADGALLERDAGSSELQFAAFSPLGEGWFAEARDGWIWLRWRAPGRAERSLRLGALPPSDFVQDIDPGPEGAAVVALWSRRAFEVRAVGGSLVAREIQFRVPPECEPPNRTDQNVAAVLFGCWSSDWGTASPKRTWSWSQPELFQISLSPPAVPSTVGWHCFSPTMIVFVVPSVMSARVRYCSMGAFAGLEVLGLLH